MSGASVRVDFYPPTFTIEINGLELEPAAAYSIRSVEVQEEINKANTFSFVVQDEFRAGEFTWLGHRLFKVGNAMRVALGYVGDDVVIANGKIQNINAQFPESGHPTFTVEGSDNAYRKLTVPSAMHVFKEKSIGDIVKKVAGIGGLQPDVNVSADSVPIKTKKGGQSYLDFLKDLAKEGHYEVQLVDTKLRFGKPRQDQKAILTLEWGKNLISFKPNLNTSQAVSAVVVRGWDKQGKKAIEVTLHPGEESPQEPRAQLSSEIAHEIFGDVVKEITDQPVNSEADARKIAQAELDRIAENLIRGNATTVGLTQLRPGVCVQLDKLGSWFTGKYYLEKVTHRLDENGYRTTFEGRRNGLERLG